MGHGYGAPMTTGARPATLQIVVDCADPHAQADWWAETLGWEAEPSDEAFIRSMLEQGLAQESDTTTHRGVLVWAEGAAIEAPGGGAGTARVLFVKVPEAKSVKNRVHVDVRSGTDLADARRALESRGARFLHDGAQGPHRWITMADPEGNEFCVTP